MKTFTRATAAEYDGGSKTTSLYAPFADVCRILGEPHRAGEADYPDDDYKTDVCWMVRSVADPHHTVTIWNYKNGPRYNDGEGLVEDIGYFSVYHTDSGFWDHIEGLIKTQAQENSRPNVGAAE
jgi:hypothetical protein